MRIQETLLVLDVHPDEVVNDICRHQLNISAEDPAYSHELDVEPGIVVHSLNPEEARKPLEDRKRFEIREPMYAFPGRHDGNPDECRVDTFMEGQDRRINKPSVVLVNPHCNRLRPRYECVMVGPYTTPGALALIACLDITDVVVSPNIGMPISLSNLVLPEFSEENLPSKVERLLEAMRRITTASPDDLTLSYKKAQERLSFWSASEVLLQAPGDSHIFSDDALVLNVATQGDVIDQIEAQTGVVPFDTRHPLDLSDAAKKALHLEGQEAYAVMEPNENFSKRNAALGFAPDGQARRRCLTVFVTALEGEIRFGTDLVVFPNAEGAEEVYLYPGYEYLPGERLVPMC